jgi:hypothetical protein
MSEVFVIITGFAVFFYTNYNQYFNFIPYFGQDTVNFSQMVIISLLQHDVLYK